MLSDTITGGVEYTITWLFKTDSVTPKDLTGFNVLVQIRERIYSSDFIVEYTELSPQIIFVPEDGSVVLSLTPNETSNFSFKKAVMDCLVSNSTDGDRSELIELSHYSGVSR